jgi:hypothetical protein
MKTNRILSLSIAISALFLFSFNEVNAQTSAKPIYVANHSFYATEMTFDMQLLADGQSGKFILAVENPEALPVTITVEGSAGIAYHSQLNSLSFRKRFDLSNKKDDEYTVIVDTGRRSYRKTVSVTTTNRSLRTLAIK